MDLGYARVSTTKQDLDRQIIALEAAGIPPERIYVDKKSGASTNRPGLQAALDYARAGDVIVVHTLDRLGRTVRDTLNLIHDLAERGVGIRNLADPIKVDSANPDDPMGQLAVVMLALFAQMERTYGLERAAGARAAAAAKGRRIGRPTVVDRDKLAYAAHLRDTGSTIAEIVAKTGITRTSLYRHLPPRPAEPVTADTHTASHGDDDGQAELDLLIAALPPDTRPRPTVTQYDELLPSRRATAPPVPSPAAPAASGPSATSRRAATLEELPWPTGYRPPCPQCGQPTIGLFEALMRVTGRRESVIAVLTQPCRHEVSDYVAQLQAGARTAATADPAPVITLPETTS